MMRRRAARQMVDVLLYFAGDAIMSVWAVYTAVIRMNRALKAAAEHIFFKRRSDARVIDTLAD